VGRLVGGAADPQISALSVHTQDPSLMPTAHCRRRIGRVEGVVNEQCGGPDLVKSELNSVTTPKLPPPPPRSPRNRSSWCDSLTRSAAASAVTTSYEATLSQASPNRLPAAQPAAEDQPPYPGM
jgi:hypothetical protein